MGVTGIYYGVGNATGIPDQHSFYAITYSDGTKKFIEFGPNHDNYLTGQNYDHSGWSPSSGNNRDLSPVAASEYGNLDAAAAALQSYADNMDQNLQANPVEYLGIANNSNTASGSLGDAWIGYEPTDAYGFNLIGTGGSLVDYATTTPSSDSGSGSIDALINANVY
jgi:hypothetical protein